MKNYCGIVGNSKPMRRVVDVIKKAAPLNMPVLIEGETGVGKELVAQAIHSEGKRASGPFVAVNTGAIPSDLVVPALFGHTKGGFTGATENADGYFAKADGGTLFLDEIGTMEERVQVALLTVLETGVYRPVGASTDQTADVRIIAAANVSLEERVRRGTFRADLLHRLGVIWTRVPPLRERLSDIPNLAKSLIGVVQASYGVSVKGITVEALNALQTHTWPGNVRELRNVIAQGCVLATPGPIDERHVIGNLTSAARPSRPSPAARATPSKVGATAAKSTVHAFRGEPGGNGSGTEGVFLPVGTSMDEMQKAYTLNCLDVCGYNVSRTAEMLKVNRRTLYSKLQRWGYDSSMKVAK